MKEPSAPSLAREARGAASASNAAVAASSAVAASRPAMVRRASEALARE